MLKEKLKILPNNPGCYLMKDKDGIVIYVGKAKNLKRRVNSYFNRVQTGKTLALVNNIVDFDYIITNTNMECLILEINLIKKYNPKYNILLKDDKTYPFIALYKDPYPLVKIERYKNRKSTKAKLFGPYPNVISARKTVELINRIYPLKKCAHGKDLCLYYHINECLGYCKYNIDKDQTNEMLKEITNILNGDIKILTKRLESEMMRASQELNYEKALVIRNSIDDLKRTINKQIIVSNTKYNFDVFGMYQKDGFLCISTMFIRDGIVTGNKSKIFNNVIDIDELYFRYIVDFYEKYPLPKEIVVCSLIEGLEELLNVKVLNPKKGDVKKILNMANLNAEMFSKEKIAMIKNSYEEKTNALESLKNLLKMDKLNRIELFDNSHLFGTYYVGAMVVFDKFEPKKDLYRKFKISTNVKDDVSAMKEVIYRRYYRVLLEGLEKPDLIIVDGGELQVKAAKEILDSLGLDIEIIGLKKDDKHRTRSIITKDLEEKDLPHDNNLYLYLTKMQDEIHRFAITYHRNIKSKGALSSVLSEIPGIGEKRRKSLLKEFGSINKIKEASIDDIARYIPREVAEKLKSFLENDNN